MELLSRISQHFHDSAELKLRAVDALAEPIRQAAERMVHCLMNEGKILACGNGGSAALSPHFAAPRVNPFEMERPRPPPGALPTHRSPLPPIGHDYDFKQIFSKQVRALGHMGDVLLAISTSGNSRNVIEAISAAHEKGMSEIALTGRDGGKMGEMLGPDDVHICVPSPVTARIQEVHLLCLHCLCDAIDVQLFGVQ